MDLWDKIIKNLDWKKLFRRLKLEDQKTKGREIWFSCPFHDEKTGSFSVNGKTGQFKCLGCGESGNLITLIADLEGISNKKSFKLLKNLAGLGDYEMGLEELRKKVQSVENSLSEQKVKKLLGVKKGERVLMPPTINLTPKALKYLSDRNISNEEIIRRKIRYCDYGYFKERIIVPIYDFENGKRYSFEARLSRKTKVIIDEDGEEEEEKKVLYPKGFPINVTVYNGHRCMIKGTKKIILVEGIMDALSLTSRGIKNTVTCFGTNLTENQVRMLTKYFQSMTILYDNDSGGIDSAKKIRKQLHSMMNVKIAWSSSKKDPKYQSIDMIKDSIRKAKSLEDVSLKKARKRTERIMVLS